MKFRVITVLFVIVVVIALAFTGCKNETVDLEDNGDPVSRHFTLVVVDVDGACESFEYDSEDTYVGETLQKAGIIAGEEGAYGLYVKTVNGKTYDYTTDGKYWAFYVDGQYSMTSVEKTKIVDGAVYEFKAE